MRKINEALLSLILLFSFTACNNNQVNSNNNKNGTLTKYDVELSKDNYLDYLDIDLKCCQYSHDDMGRIHTLWRIEVNGAMDFAIYENCTLRYQIGDISGIMKLSKGGFATSRYYETIRISTCSYAITSVNGNLSYYF